MTTAPTATARPATAQRDDAVAALAAATHAVARGEPLHPTLEVIVGAAVAATGAELGVVWLRRGLQLVVAAVRAESEVLEAELEGLLSPSPEATRRLLGERLGGYGEPAVLSLALSSGIDELGTLELLRGGAAFDGDDERLAAVAADLAALAVRVCGDAARGNGERLLEVAGEALDAVSQAAPAAARIARLATVASGADGALAWTGNHQGLVLAGVHGPLEATPELQRIATEVVADDRSHEQAETGAGSILTLQLGEPPIGALQLLYPSGRAPSGDGLVRLTTFAVRAAHALRFATRSHDLGIELERSRALLAVVGEAIARLSLAHTLETALERVSVLLDVDRVAVYLEQDGTHGSERDGPTRLVAAAARNLSGPHETVAGGLLELTLGPLRGRGYAEVPDVAQEPALAAVAAQAGDAAITAAIALPLVTEAAPIGLLAAYPRRPRPLGENEVTLLVSLAAQLAVAVQNAQLHERTAELSQTLERTLSSEREKAKRLQALYDISRSFAQSLSLETTLDELARSLVTLLEVDAAVIRVPDERGSELVARAVFVNDERVDAAVRALLARPQPLDAAELRRLVDHGESLVVDARTAEELGGSLTLLAPFLAKGSTAAVVPIVLSGELLATLTIVSLHPGRPVAGEVVETAVSITGQAALAIDNARLYTQQKKFADTMQQSLRPQVVPSVPGLEAGHVYEPSARVDVGGDVYDYLTLGDGRLAVVLGDVTGHGVEATADMAMAKFVFRSLAREHVEPGAFLAAANEVVASEIAVGKFITMVEVVIDPKRGVVACASAGHPQPRIVLADGSVHGIDVRGLALGIETPQTYESATVELPPGALVALYTDGVVEARCDGELFGLERLDALLAASRHLGAAEVAQAALDTCRDWSDGDLTDDFAVVIIKRAP